jgi:glycolate oxidase FAD binding subunit
LKLAHADGNESKCGGRVVKNVAGYDMNKLYVGSYGTLAVITELTFKLRPLPESDVTLVVSARSEASLLDFANRVLAAELQPASVFLTKRLVDDLIESMEEADALLIRFIDNEAAVNHQLDWVKRATDHLELKLMLLTDDQGEPIWRRVADLDRRAANAVRISVPVSTVESVLAKLAPAGCAAAIDLGLGIIRIAFDEDERKAAETIKRWRFHVAGSGGTLFVERASSALRQEVDAWGDAGPASSLMKSIKTKFDPESLLNPGRLVAGI